MPWTYDLKLATKPYILAGPILRKVTASSVTVWFALKAKAVVRLSVLDRNGEIFWGERVSCRIGKHLHIVAVTANRIADGRNSFATLSEGEVYRYDAELVLQPEDQIGPVRRTMTTAVNAEGDANSQPFNLGYGSFNLPTFCLPPSDLSKLRLIHGSCRKPHGEGADALSLLDAMIREKAAVPAERPHQLVLSGDQIYADDVAPSLLMMLMATADQLLAWPTPESLPVRGKDDPPDMVTPLTPLTPAREIMPFHRALVADRAHFTTEDNDNHLLSLGEYICMYLFVWSDVLWNTSAIPSFDDIHAASKSPITFLDPGSDEEEDAREEVDDAVSSTNKKLIFRLRKFHGTLQPVRRALANIPTYMIFDDHEITDDFNMHRKFVESVYANDLGRQIIQNGLVAYSLCQHWGNVPEDFVDSGEDSPPPGAKLLRVLARDTPYASKSRDLRKLVSVHTTKELRLRTPVETYHDAGSLNFNFVVSAPAHEIIFTDTRTWRSYPDGAMSTPDFLPRSQLEAQIVNAPREAGSASARAMILVLSTNCPPTKIARFGAINPKMAKHAMGESSPDVAESWELPSRQFDMLMWAITERLPTNFAGVKQGFAVVLSGDVHSSSASRVALRGTGRLGDSPRQNQAVNVVMAQLVGSAFNNENDATREQEREGHNYYNSLGGFEVAGEAVPEGHVGWKVNPAEPRPAAVDEYNHVLIPRESGTRAINPIRDVGGYKHEYSTIVELLRPPDWNYRLDYIVSENSNTMLDFARLNSPPFSTDTSPEGRIATANRLRGITRNLAKYDNSKQVYLEIIGRNNICELNFILNNQKPKYANHLVRSRGAQGPNLASFRVSLDPEDTTFPIAGVMP